LAFGLLERYGWSVLVALALFLILRSQGRQWWAKRKRRIEDASPAHAEHAELVAERVRQARLAQQAAWNAAAAAAPRSHHGARQESEEEKRQRRVYGQKQHNDALNDDSKMSMEEAFGSEYYKAFEGRKKKPGSGGSVGSGGSDLPMPRQSGFKPMHKPPPASGGGGGGRRFGGGGPKRGG
jgi:hypothetical protein